MAKFRNRIRTGLKKIGWTVPKMARELDVHPQTVYNYLAERSDIGSLKVEAMLRIINREIRKLELAKKRAGIKKQKSK